MSFPTIYLPFMPDFWAVNPYAPDQPIKPAILRWEYVQAIQEYTTEALEHLIEMNQDARMANPRAREGLEMDERELRWRRDGADGPFR